MTRPPFEVADIVRQHGDRFLETHQAWVTGQHRRVLRVIAQCRTAALGGHRDRCEQCAHPVLSYNSCRDRHCPKCLTAARNAWVTAREQELLPVGYVHIVFTMPEPLARLALANKRVVYDLLFQAAAETVRQVAANPKRLGADVGGLMVLHTWGQRLQHHPHVHCVVPMGGLAPDGTRWIHTRPRFFLPIPVLRTLFRGKLIAGVRAAFRHGRLHLPGSLAPPNTAGAFRAFLRSLYRQTWVVYAKPPFGSPAHVLHYLARYTHRVAISNHRLVAITDDTVSFLPSPIALARHSRAESALLVTCRVAISCTQRKRRCSPCRSILERMETRGTAVAVLDDVAHDPVANGAQDHVSRTGTLAYRRLVGDSNATVQWLDTTGKQEPLLASPGAYVFVVVLNFFDELRRHAPTGQ